MTDTREKEFQTLIYTFSHDLRQALSKIMTIGELLEEKAKNFDETDKDYLRRMQEAGRQAKILIDGLTGYVRMTDSAEERRAIELKDLLWEVQAEMEPEIKASGAVITVNASGKVRGNFAQLKQAFLNVLLNSVKFSKENTIPRISVESHDAGAMTEIQINDNGIGFDEKYASKIFEPFQRLHGKGKYDGAGIGLSVTQWILRNHGGDITVKSVPGEGSRWRIVLPHE